MRNLVVVVIATLVITGQARAGHNVAVGFGNCGYCHKANLIKQHGGFVDSVCVTCHKNSAVEVITTISAGVAGQAYSCSSCHTGGLTHLDNHNAFMTNYATMSGYQPAATAAFVQPTTFTAVSPATKEYQVCFKCHSYKGFGAVTNGVSGLVGPSGVNFTDQAMEFNPANMSFHPVMASAGANRGATSNIKSPWTRTSIMSCSDCHYIAAVTDPAGPHATASNFLLKGPATAWNNTLKLRISSGESIFCSNCHDVSDWNNSRFSAHRDSKHEGIPCFNCHQAIPHGGQRMGLLTAGAGYSSTVGAAAVTDKAPYNQSTTGSKLYIKSYPSATGSWGQTNCGCNGTNHN